MAYTKHTWAAGPEGNTPITYTKLNEIETGIYNAHTGYASAQSTATAASNRAVTNANNITNLTTRMTAAESDITQLQSDVVSLDGRVEDLEENGGGGSASLTVTKYVNNGACEIANNAWRANPALSNWPGYTQPGDLTLVNPGASPGVIQVVTGGLYLFSITAVDTQNPTGQANFFIELDRATSSTGSSVSAVLARFQLYATNQGSGTAIVSLSTGDYLRTAFRQNATGGSFILPDGVSGINNNGYAGLSIYYVKLA